MRVIPILSAFACALTSSVLAGNNYNVLIIAVDDLRPEMSCYGSPAIPTPNMDRLADQGVLFQRAYCQEAICHASRASLFSGMYPVPYNGYHFRTPVETGLPGLINLPELFKVSGYHTVGINKTYHHYWRELDNWTENYLSPTPGSDWRNYVTQENQSIQQRLLAEDRARNGENSRFGPNNLPAAKAIEKAPDALADLYIDSDGTAFAIQKLRELKDQPFFMVMGYRRPHLPFNAPEKFFKQFPLEEIALPSNPYRTQGASIYAFMNSVELRAYSDIPNEGPVTGSDRRVRELLQAYYASVAYVDDLIGQLLDTLESLQLREQTIIILLGDHGFKLGEHAEWGKHANFEVDLRSPLIVSVPGMQTGRETFALAEFVDIYPTLVELCGLERPVHIEGKSMVPLLENKVSDHREYAFSRYPRDQRITGHSIRTDAYRYTRWRDAETGEIVGQELFDHRIDPDENVNLADHPEMDKVMSAMKDRISAKLETIEQHRKAIP